MARRILYKIVDHGIESPDFFLGLGVACTLYDYVVTGIGDTFNEALDNALDILADDEHPLIDNEEWAAECKRIMNEEKLDDTVNTNVCASDELAANISNTISPDDYTNCVLEPGMFCEHCHTQLLNEQIENCEHSLFYYVSILYFIEKNEWNYGFTK